MLVVIFALYFAPTFGNDISLEKPYSLFDYFWISSGATVRTDDVIHLTPDQPGMVGRIWTKEVFQIFVILFSHLGISYAWKLGDSFESQYWVYSPSRGRRLSALVDARRTKYWYALY
jgi:hypothetical protein